MESRCNAYIPPSADQEYIIGQSQTLFDGNGQTVDSFSEELAEMVDKYIDEHGLAFSPDALGMEDMDFEAMNVFPTQPLPQVNPFESQPSPERAMQAAQHDTTTNNGQNNFHWGGGNEDPQQQPVHDFGHADSPPVAPTADNRMSEVQTVDGQQNEDIASTDDEYEGNFKLIISLRKTRVHNSNVKGQGGCVVYYPSPGQAVVEPDFKSGQARLPISMIVPRESEDGVVQLEEMKWTSEGEKKYTMRILSNMGGGLCLAASKQGNLYAKRHCMAKIFWTSTQRGDDDEAIELERGKQTLIFDAGVFRYESAVAVRPGGKQESIRRPAIRFVFGQKWSIKSEPFNTKLVTARVEPQHENDISDMHATGVGAKNHSLFDSYHSGHVYISGDGVEGFGAVA